MESTEILRSIDNALLDVCKIDELEPLTSEQSSCCARLRSHTLQVGQRPNTLEIRYFDLGNHSNTCRTDTGYSAKCDVTAVASHLGIGMCCYWIQ